MRKEKTITVLTPAYNRGNCLSKLYESLCNQTEKDFIWMIIDDGSVDNTREYAEKWISEKQIEIIYIYKENGGKHTALNEGIKMIDSPLTFIVDSDDYLLNSAIETIKKDFANISCDYICGMAYLRQSKDGHYLTNKLVPQDGLVESYCECRYGRNIDGDMAEVWITKCLKEFPFPVFPNEKFMSEDVVWIQMSKKYKMVFFNNAIYMSDYLEGGLTKTRRKMNYNSPNGCMYRGEVHLEANLPIKYKIKAMLYYSVYGKIAGFGWKELFCRSKNKALYVCCFFLSLYIYIKWRK